MIGGGRRRALEKSEHLAAQLFQSRLPAPVRPSRGILENMYQQATQRAPTLFTCRACNMCTALVGLIQPKKIEIFLLRKGDMRDG